MLFRTILFIGVLSISSIAFASITVVEGKDAKLLYEKKKNTSIVLSQKQKMFFLIGADGKRHRKPAAIKIQAGDVLFIENDEKRIVHNIYDTTDDSWILKKQLPHSLAGVIFSSPGKHELKCAIHPKMTVSLIVE